MHGYLFFTVADTMTTSQIEKECHELLVEQFLARAEETRTADMFESIHLAHERSSYGDRQIGKNFMKNTILNIP